MSRDRPLRATTAGATSPPSRERLQKGAQRHRRPSATGESGSHLRHGRLPLCPARSPYRDGQWSRTVLNIERAGIILHTERYEDCVRFYRDVIGLPVEFEKDEPEQILTCLALGEAYLMIEIGGLARDTVKSRQENPITIRLNVANVDAAADYLRRRGVEVSIIKFAWGTIGRFRDPDGNPCQLRDQPMFGS